MEPSTQEDYDRLEQQTIEDLILLCVTLGQNYGDQGSPAAIDAWYSETFARLQIAHTDAAVLGRRLLVPSTDLLATDRIIAYAAMIEQEYYLSRFERDLKNRKYRMEDGSLNVEAVQYRSTLYARVLLGTANEAFVNAVPDDGLIHWHLGIAEEHCESCPAIAKLSPFTKGTLPTKPRQCDTECLMNCRCYLRYEKTTGFRA